MLLHNSVRNIMVFRLKEKVKIIHMKTNKIHTLFIVVIILSTLFSCNKSSDSEIPGEDEIGIKVGQTAPGFTLSDKNGIEINLNDFKGKMVLVDFWASWCSYCRAENPELVSLYSEYKDKGFEIIGISIDTDRNDWLKAIDDDGIEYIQVIDQNGFESPIVDQYGVSSIPSMFLLDQDGVIIRVSAQASVISTVVRNNLK